MYKTKPIISPGSPLNPPWCRLRYSQAQAHRRKPLKIAQVVRGKGGFQPQARGGNEAVRQASTSPAGRVVQLRSKSGITRQQCLGVWKKSRGQADMVRHYRSTQEFGPNDDVDSDFFFPAQPFSQPQVLVAIAHQACDQKIGVKKDHPAFQTLDVPHGLDPPTGMQPGRRDADFAARRPVSPGVKPAWMRGFPPAR